MELAMFCMRDLDWITTQHLPGLLNELRKLALIFVGKRLDCLFPETHFEMLTQVFDLLKIRMAGY